VIVVIFLVATAVSAITTIAAFESKPPRLAIAYIAKPLTTVLIILFALLRSGGSLDGYSGWIVAGLAFSLAGDIFLMLPKDAFLPGLLSFLVTHVCYLTAFTQPGSLFTPLIPFLPIAILAGGALIWLWPGVRPKLRIPVFVYVVLLAAMTGQGIARAMTLSSVLTLAAAVGSVLFLCSDTLLAVNRFRKPLAHHQALVLSTYFLGQWLIAFSIAPW
jgi:uncharacterized membrane protein YhhN